MKALETWMLGYLVNSVWQVPLVFGAAWMAARLARRAGPLSGPAMEHKVWVSALLVEAVLPGSQLHAGELLQRLWSLAGRLWSGGGLTRGEVRVSVGAGTVAGHGLLLPERVFAGLAVGYGCGVLYFAGRLGWRLWRTSRMRRRAVPVVLTGEAARMWERCRKAFGVETAEIAESCMRGGPVTVGAWRGVLLLPAGFAARVTEGGREDDWAAVVAHECAHLRRRDFLKNAVYGVLTLPVACHPALWLTRSRMAESREMVCDAMAAEAGAGVGMGRERYARSLLRLAALLLNGPPARILHAIGIFDANSFERRVMNLTGKQIEMKRARRMAVAAASVVIGVATCGSALALRTEVGTPAGRNAAASRGPIRVSGGVMAANVLTQVQPVYPLEAKEAKITGAIVLKAVIGKDGVVENLQVVSGPDQLRGSALEAVRQWTYKPFLLNGVPMEVETTVTVTYSLGH